MTADESSIKKDLVFVPRPWRSRDTPESDPEFMGAFRVVEAPLPEGWDDYDKDIDAAVREAALAALAELEKAPEPPAEDDGM